MDGSSGTIALDEASRIKEEAKKSQRFATDYQAIHTPGMKVTLDWSNRTYFVGRNGEWRSPDRFLKKKRREEKKGR